MASRGRSIRAWIARGAGTQDSRGDTRPEPKTQSVEVSPPKAATVPATQAPVNSVTATRTSENSVTATQTDSWSAWLSARANDAWKTVFPAEKIADDIRDIGLAVAAQYASMALASMLSSRATNRQRDVLWPYCGRPGMFARLMCYGAGLSAVGEQISSTGMYQAPSWAERIAPLVVGGLLAYGAASGAVAITSTALGAMALVAGVAAPFLQPAARALTTLGSYFSGANDALSGAWGTITGAMNLPPLRGVPAQVAGTLAGTLRPVHLATSAANLVLAGTIAAYVQYTRRHWVRWLSGQEAWVEETFEKEQVEPERNAVLDVLGERDCAYVGDKALAQNRPTMERIAKNKVKYRESFTWGARVAMVMAAFGDSSPRDGVPTYKKMRKRAKHMDEGEAFAVKFSPQIVNVMVGLAHAWYKKKNQAAATPPPDPALLDTFWNARNALLRPAAAT